MSTKSEILSIFEKNKSKYISGSIIAENLGISRNAVWKAIKALQNDGYNIEAVSNRGYMLTENQDIVNQENIRQYLKIKDMAKEIVILKTIDSTNTYAKSLAQQGAEAGLLVVSEEQTSGKGRMGRVFQSPKGSGIYFSVILRPSVSIEYAPLITSCVAVAVAEALESLSGADIKIKWVNDIFLNNKKISGILTEAAISFESGHLDYAIVGIGINVGSIKAKLADDMLNIASSIEDETGIRLKRAEVVAEVVNRMEEHLAHLQEREFMNAYRERLYMLGKSIIVTKNNIEREAVALDIDNNACLIVEYLDGTKDTLNSGEARIIKK